MPLPVREIAAGPLKVLIVGGGIAGILLAILLEQRGHTIKLIEKSKEWKPVGGGITLTPNGVKILQGLGLLSGLQPYMNGIGRINIANNRGNVLSSFALDGHTCGHAGTFTIQRAHLQDMLAGTLQHTQVHTGTTFRAIENTGNRVKVIFSDGNMEYFDLVVGCDGINSSVRNTVFSGSVKRFAGYASWRYIAHGVNVGDTRTITEMWGRGRRFGIVPLQDNMVHCFASVNCSGNSQKNRGITIGEFKDTFSDFGGCVPALMDAIRNSDQLVYNDLEDVYVSEWHCGRIVLAGDAAHGMTPNLTQGASMAIEDVYVLANKLSAAPTIEGAIAGYCSVRVPRVRAIQRKSRLLGWVGQVSNPVLCGVRNYLWSRVPDRWIQNDLENLLVRDVMYL